MWRDGEMMRAGVYGGTGNDAGRRLLRDEEKMCIRDSNKAIKRTEEKRNELQEQFTYQLQKSKQRRYGPPKNLI